MGIDIHSPGLTDSNLNSFASITSSISEKAGWVGEVEGRISFFFFSMQAQINPLGDIRKAKGYNSAQFLADLFPICINAEDFIL